MKRLVVSAVLMCALSGCYRMSVRSSAIPAGPMNHDSGVNLMWGLVPTESKAPECKAGFSRVDVYWPWWGVLVRVVTLGIVAPTRTDYVCAQGGGQHGGLGEGSRTE
jgi:hypothetical protein